MGMYTELDVTIELDMGHKDIKRVVSILNYMLSGDEDDLNEDDLRYFDNDLFNTRRWHFMLRSSSAYFDDHEESTLVGSTLRVDFDMKNYDNEIEKFLDWIHPFSISRGEIGTTRYEEFDLDEIIVFDDKGWSTIKDEHESEEKFWDQG